MLLLVSACAPSRFVAPTQPGAPSDRFVDIHRQVSSACRGVRSFTAELGLAGRVGTERVRGRVVAGFEQPASMRLEGLAPFGAPGFILAATAADAVLLLPRDRAVVRGPSAAELLEALTGVDLDAARLQALLSGCVSPAPTAVRGERFSDDLESLTLADGAVLYVRRRNGAWRLEAARVDRWSVEYPAWQATFPQSVRLTTIGAGPPVDLTATLAQVEANIDIDDAAFRVVVPEGTRAISLADLRASGPLRGQ